MGNILPYRIFKNLCCKVLEFSKKENQEKSYTLMNKERLEHFFIFFVLAMDFFRTCILTFTADIYLFPMLHPSMTNVPIPYSPKTSKNDMLSSTPRGHKLETPPAIWDHHWLTHIWPISLIHAPWKHQKTKSPPAFLGGHKTKRSPKKGSSDKIKQSKAYCK